MDFDTGLRKAAQSILGAVGTTVTIRRVTLGTYDVATGTATDLTIDTAVKGRLDEYTSRELNDYVLLGDRKLIVAAADLGFVPTPKDKVLVDTAIYDVVRVVGIMGRDMLVTYEMQIRGAA